MPAAWAQFELGSVAGLVTDPRKAPVAGAAVEIRSLSTNVKRDVTTSSSGEYNSLPLQPDRSVELSVGVSQRVQADFSLELSSVTEQVNVSEQASVIGTAASEIGLVRAAKEIGDLPLNTRNFTQFVQLAPRVEDLYSIELPTLHFTNIAAADWLQLLPIRTSTGTEPVGAFAGTAAFTWNKPMAPGAVVAEATLPSMPPIGHLASQAWRICRTLTRQENLNDGSTRGGIL